MNEFTKEDLERILRQLLEDRQWVDDLVNPDPLIEKIQSMIDNYCEHEWAFYISPHGNVVRCNKCNKGLP